MSYLIDGLVFAEKSIIIAIPLFLAYVGWHKYIRHEKREFLWVDFLFISYGIFVLYVTGIIGTSWHFDYSSLSFNLIPFTNEEWKLVFFNMFLFMPMGIFLAFYFKEDRRLIRILAIGLCVAMVIELIQLFFVGRLADIDDVIANTAGCVIGYGIFLLGCRISWQDYLLSGIILSVISLLWGMRYHYYCAGDILLYNLGVKSIVEVSRFHYADPISMILSLIAIDLTYGNKAGKKHSCLPFAIVSFVVSLVNFIY